MRLLVADAAVGGRRCAGQRWGRRTTCASPLTSTSSSSTPSPSSLSTRPPPPLPLSVQPPFLLPSLPSSTQRPARVRLSRGRDLEGT
eukprot:1427721-Rhodomonas_salina.1